MSNLSITTLKPGITEIMIDRPDVKNAFDNTLMQEFTQAILLLNEDAHTRVIFVRAKGNVFCAGGDLGWMKRNAALPEEENIADAKHLSRMLETLRQSQKPTIAIVEGHAYGGGVGLIAACDIALSTANINFCLSEVRLGLVPGIISPYVTKAIGRRWSQYYMLTADLIPAEKACAIGLIHEIHAQGTIMERAFEIANSLQKGAPEALHVTKILIDEIVEMPFDTALEDLTTRTLAKRRASKEGIEGVSAFLEKRKPSWLE